MNEPFLDFELTVASAYEWEDFSGEIEGEPVVAPPEAFRSPVAVEKAYGRLEVEGQGTGPILCPVGESSTFRQYRPMERKHAALFRSFAALDYRDREAIRAFANIYGLLGVSSKYAYGESHLIWAREVCLMKEALELGQPRSAADEARERAIWSKHDAEIRERQRKRRVKAEDPVERRRRERRRKLTWLFGVHLQYVQARMTFDPDVAPRLTFAPGSLLAAMWLQLALAVVGDKKFLACKFCRSLFEISTEHTGFRSHREFCSDPSCKTKDYRRRKRTALELAKRGLPLSTIAERIETKKATVRGWLSALKKRPTSPNGSESERRRMT